MSNTVQVTSPLPAGYALRLNRDADLQAVGPALPVMFAGAPIVFGTNTTCAQCGGSGTRTCPFCSGKGCGMCNGGTVTCPDCGGSGNR